MTMKTHKKKTRKTNSTPQGSPVTLAKRFVRTSEPEPGVTYIPVGAQLEEREPRFVTIDEETHRRLAARKRPKPER
jgi:hypothetical protein